MGREKREKNRGRERRRPKRLLKIINLVGICVSERRRHKEFPEQRGERLSDPDPIG